MAHEPYVVEWISPAGRYRTRDCNTLALAREYAQTIEHRYEDSDIEVLLPDGKTIRIA